MSSPAQCPCSLLCVGGTPQHIPRDAQAICTYKQSVDDIPKPQNHKALQARSGLAAEGRHPRVAGRGLLHTRAQIPTAMCGARIQARGAPAAGRGPAALTQHRDCAGAGPRGQSRVCRLRSHSVLLGLAVPSLPWLSAPGVLPRIQESCPKYKEYFLQRVNTGCFCGREGWFKSHRDGGEKWVKLQAPLSEALAAPGAQCLCPAQHRPLPSPLCLRRA